MAEYGPGDVPFLFVNGRDLLAQIVHSFDDGTEGETEEVPAIGPTHGTWRQNRGIGVRSVTLSYTGLFDDATDRIHQAINGQQMVAQVISYGLATGAIGKLFVGLRGAFGSKYKRAMQRPGVTRASVECTVSGEKDEGVILHGKVEETGDTWDTESTPVDEADVAPVTFPIVSISEAAAAVVVTGAPHGRTTGDKVLIADVVGSSPEVNGEHVITVLSTTSFSIPINTSAGDGGTGGTFVVTKTQNGGVGYVQVPDLTLGGYDSATVNVRHSADNAVWATLLTFTAITTAPSAERKTVTGTVNRYLATSGAYVGAGSDPAITPAVGFARAA